MSRTTICTANCSHNTTHQGEESHSLLKQRNATAHRPVHKRQRRQDAQAAGIEQHVLQVGCNQLHALQEGAPVGQADQVVAVQAAIISYTPCLRLCQV